MKLSTRRSSVTISYKLAIVRTMKNISQILYVIRIHKNFPTVETPEKKELTLQLTLGAFKFLQRWNFPKFSSNLVKSMVYSCCFALPPSLDTMQVASFLITMLLELSKIRTCFKDLREAVLQIDKKKKYSIIELSTFSFET